MTITHWDAFAISNQMNPMSHIQARLLEGQVNMALTLKLFQDTTLAQLSEIREAQEAFKTTLKNICDDFTSTHSVMSDNLVKLQANIDKLSPTITSLVSSPPDPVSPSSSFSSTDLRAKATTDLSLENPVIQNSPSPKTSSEASSEALVEASAEASAEASS